MITKKNCGSNEANTKPSTEIIPMVAESIPIPKAT